VAKCDGNILYSCIKMEEMRYVEAIPEMGGREDKGE
jgi:hypothetical protein